MFRAVLVWIVSSASVLLIGYAVHRFVYKPMPPPMEKDDFFLNVAVKFKAPGICDKINATVEGSGGAFSAPGYQVSYLQSQCYFDVAHETGNLSLCDKVRTAHKDFADGSKYSPKSCRQEASRRIASSYPVKPEVLAQLMGELGYRQEILSEYYVHNSRLEIALAWDHDFERRLRASPGFDEPLSEERLRQADDLEYLYYPMALDNHDPVFCAKISPNAVVLQGKVRLRFLCFSHLAYKDGRSELCNALPNRPISLSGAYSRDNCKTNFLPSKIASSWSSFPTPWFLITPQSLQHALAEIGAEFPPTQVPDGEYSYFFDQLLNHGDPAVRADFLRRVAALQ